MMTINASGASEISDASGASKICGTSGVGGIELEITGLTADSRAVRPGFLFAALPGGKVDGRAFIGDALGRGAVAVLGPHGMTVPDASIRVISDEVPRRAFALMAAAFYRRQPNCVVAVTGTNGKTSTVQFAQQLWAAADLSAAALGTLGLTTAPDLGTEFGGGASMTTPDPVALHATLAALAGAGVDRVAMEASSHGLDQFRLDGVRLKAAAFTNLTRDHLDYHGDMPAYFTAKAGLFGRVLAADGVAVLNVDVPEFSELSAICGRRGVRVLGYGEAAAADLRIIGIEALPHGQRLTLSVLGRPVVVDLALVGRFQAYNALAALGLLLAVEPELADAVVAKLGCLRGVPGRMQPVGLHPTGAAVVVDYAHTPNALETVLLALRPHAVGRLLVVFGCGGDRDRGKRPVMGEIAARLADRVYITDDNPRSEVPATIRREILASCRGASEIGDRAAAIRAAVRELTLGDLLVIAGKGHEQGQIVGTEVRPFDDAAEARAAVAECCR
ncbi:MAG: UDP-N-acetylmuramoyl-L-alanyl-D-glutamate--2,6-diaminopimelate ligase [Rhodospirillaceae bacterium]